MKRREMDAVAVEVPDSATGAGVRGKKAGARKRARYLEEDRELEAPLT